MDSKAAAPQGTVLPDLLTWVAMKCYRTQRSTYTRRNEGAPISGVASQLELLPGRTRLKSYPGMKGHSSQRPLWESSPTPTGSALCGSSMLLPSMYCGLLPTSPWAGLPAMNHCGKSSPGPCHAVTTGYTSASYCRRLSCLSYVTH